MGIDPQIVIDRCEHVVIVDRMERCLGPESVNMIGVISVPVRHAFQRLLKTADLHLTSIVARVVLAREQRSRKAEVLRLS